MTYDGGGSSNPDGNIAVSPDVWTNTSTTTQTSNDTNASIRAAVLTALNGAIDGLNVFSYVQGAVDLARALSDFSYNIEQSLGCVAVDLEVVASGLQVAAHAFASLDHALATTFASLESQMATFTTDTTLTASTVTTYTALQSVPKSVPDSGIGSFFSSAWHHITNWGSEVYHGTVHGLESIGAPVWLAVGIGAVAIVLYYVVVGSGAAAAAA